MKTESLGVVYHMSKEDVIKAIDMFLKAMDQDVTVVKVEPEFEREYYNIGNFEQSYNEIFDGLKVVCK